MLKQKNTYLNVYPNKCDLNKQEEMFLISQQITHLEYYGIVPTLTMLRIFLVNITWLSLPTQDLGYNLVIFWVWTEFE